MTKYLGKKAALMSAAFCLLGTTSCANLDHFGGSRQSVEDWGKERQFLAIPVLAGAFDLLALQRVTRTSNTLTIYIEGDGAAWRTPRHPPRDPTPQNPVALALAAADPSPAVVYLGRPCQYLDERALANCSPIWWTTQRFSTEVLTAYEQALDTLKAQSGATTFRLVGYSGGGVIATLLAMRRHDVSSLITVASPLALGEWTRLHGISALNNSLDPLIEPGILPPATHWIGLEDAVVPLSVVEKFAKNKGGTVRPVKGYDHDCCWTNTWKQLLKESP